MSSRRIFCADPSNFQRLAKKFLFFQEGVARLRGNIKKLQINFLAASLQSRALLYYKISWRNGNRRKARRPRLRSGLQYLGGSAEQGGSSAAETSRFPPTRIPARNWYTQLRLLKLINDFCTCPLATGLLPPGLLFPIFDSDVVKWKYFSFIRVWLKILIDSLLWLGNSFSVSAQSW